MDISYKFRICPALKIHLKSKEGEDYVMSIGFIDMNITIDVTHSHHKQLHRSEGCALHLRCKTHGMEGRRIRS